MQDGKIGRPIAVVFEFDHPFNGAQPPCGKGGGGGCRDGKRKRKRRNGEGAPWGFWERFMKFAMYKTNQFTTSKAARE